MTSPIPKRRLLPAMPALSALFAVAMLIAAQQPAGAQLKGQPLNADEWLTHIGPRRGLVMLLGEGLGDAAAALASRSELTIYIQASDAADVLATRRKLDAAGLLGTRVYVDGGDWSRLNLGDNLADAVIVTGSARKPGGATEAELMRVLHPGGTLIAGGKVSAKAWPRGAGQWTHPYHGPDNNPQAEDTIATGPYLTQYLATPWYGPMPQVTVSAGGRLFKAFGHIAFKEREWPLLNKLIAVNAFNGTVLWQRDLTPGFMVHRNTMAATAEVLYLADAESCKLIDTATGKLLDQIVVPEGLAEGPAWKWMALQDGVLYALVGKKEPIDKTLRGTRTGSGWPWNGMGDIYARKGDSYPLGFGHTVLAFDVKTKRVLWSLREKQVLDSRAFCMAAGRLFIYSHKNFLGALNAKTGSYLWKTSAPDVLGAIGEHDPAQTPSRGYASSSYAKCTDKVVFFAGPQRPNLVAVSAETGKLMWQRKDGNFQLVIHPDAVYAMGKTNQSKMLDPLTGRVLADITCLRGNCTRATGTADAIFARGDRHGGTMQLSVAGNTPHRIPAMRPACQDGVIAANGLLYWGPWMCDCNHSLVGMISLGPAGEFTFGQKAIQSQRLASLAADPAQVAAFDVSPNDWPTYRANNTRSASLPVNVATTIKLLWQTPKPGAKPAVEPTAPVTAGGLVFIAGHDGVVRALDGTTGRTRWTAYTGGRVRYAPTVSNGRVYVGSDDGHVYCFEAATGRGLWQFRAAPVPRRIPVYGSLASNWPVASGVLVQDGVAYAAAGIVSPDGTHVYALDAVTGKIKWQNNTSGRLMGGDVVAGVSVQGHMLMHEGKLYMAGGNVVSPAVYDAATGKCLNTLTDEWQKGPRGSELFLTDGQVAVVDKMMYSPRQYIPSRYYRKYLLQASSGGVVIQGTEKAMTRVAPGPDGKPRVMWTNDYFVETSAVALGGNAVVVLGTIPDKTDAKHPVPALMALNPADGKPYWAQQLPALPAPWGLALDRDGRVVVTLVNGQTLCFGR